MSEKCEQVLLPVTRQLCDMGKPMSVLLVDSEEAAKVISNLEPMPVGITAVIGTATVGVCTPKTKKLSDWIDMIFQLHFWVFPFRPKHD